MLSTAEWCFILLRWLTYVIWMQSGGVPSMPSNTLLDFLIFLRKLRFCFEISYMRQVSILVSVNRSIDQTRKIMSIKPRPMHSVRVETYLMFTRRL
ncbi:hypothetical protein GGR58DRAFT_465177 [Xylaria digitata]|nr:hypothetical protein GGR58DRAFT_465177 [Xylaria digitata]